MVRFEIYVLDYVIWFFVGSVSPVGEIESDIQISHNDLVEWYIIFLESSSLIIALAKVKASEFLRN